VGLDHGFPDNALVGTYWFRMSDDLFCTMNDKCIRRVIFG